MAPRPLVLLTCDQRTVDGTTWHATPATYVEAIVYGADAVPILLPAMGGAIDVDTVLDRVDGVLLTGARSNVHPMFYGEDPTPEHEPFDAARDATTLPLIRRAIERGIPLLAICRGFQELNVALGGSLHAEIQTFEGRMDHRAPAAPTDDQRYGIRHPVHLVDDGCLGRIVEADEITVNSLHHQGLATLAPGLVVEATAPDGTVEAVRVEAAAAFAVGVQWHPEYWVRSDKPSGKIFAAFGAAVAAHAAAR
ncbi:gamma-glutamyl-gamma-aminobutyrate hydrolase family protein [Siculibacillus lacustris]|uniref:gamma-glutamyl-gamma-aminobutyrate hydrolase n=1 Tax=Siculibacillus lacustris TaxID=1549641 RepID=A0A4Q9VWQ4_9HYPH|nr:gamma-glutamyl-gamma-aminobutyrate hydrolase family protein [Siculibacillus lacustris]TBW40769.1 gamma-glutamyl-gamma-aminobutyrate hydrolase family protein [Siculibacillus lacustris]